MRNFLITLFFGCVLSFSAHATIFTVSASANHPAQFTTLQAAHDAANSGDTIQWYGESSVSPSTAQFSKPLVISGVNSLTNRPSINFSSASSGTRILGGSYLSLDGDQSISFFEVKNSWVANICCFGGNLSSINCIIGGFSGLTSSGNFFSFHNCVFLRNQAIFPGVGQTAAIQFYFPYASVIIDRCIFMSNLDAGSSSFTSSTLNISNSVFVGTIPPAICFSSDTAFDSNLFVDYSIDNSQFCGPNIAASNIMNAPNPFVNGNLSNLNTLDFRLNESSEGNNAATDGSDIGLHGGLYPWPINSHYGLNPVGVPVINSLTLENYTIGVSEQLHFEVEGTIPSNE